MRFGVRIQYCRFEGARRRAESRCWAEAFCVLPTRALLQPTVMETEIPAIAKADKHKNAFVLTRSCVLAMRLERLIWELNASIQRAFNLEMSSRKQNSI